MELVLADVVDAPYSLRSFPDEYEIRIVHQFENGKRGLKRQRDQEVQTEEDLAREEVISEILPNGSDARVELIVEIKREPVRYSQRTRFFFPPHRNETLLRNLWEGFREKVKVSVHIKFTVEDEEYDDTDVINCDPFDGMKIQCKGEKLSCVGIGIVDNEVQLALERTPRPKMNLKLAVVVPEESVSPAKVFPFPRMVLEKELSSDVVICVAGGAEIKSHKCFLQACSPVFEAMFRNDMMESQTGRVDMTDLSERGVRAFLRYVYYGDLKEPKKDIGMALELFMAAHKYDVRRLEKTMLALLMEKKDEDFSVELAFKVYILTRNIVTAVGLKRKVLRVLKTKKDDLELLEEYRDLMDTNAAEVMELRKEMATCSGSQGTRAN